jgi:hypothetical protein
MVSITFILVEWRLATSGASLRVTHPRECPRRCVPLRLWARHCYVVICGMSEQVVTERSGVGAGSLSFLP